MAVSTCVKCGNTTFEAREAAISGSNFLSYFIQCTSCGGVVGVQEEANIGSTLKNHEGLLKQIASALNVSLP